MTTAVWTVLLLGAGALFYLNRSGGSLADLEGFRDRGAVVLDVRTPTEFQSSHVKGAINVPVDVLLDRIGELTIGPIVVYCASGMRSRKARAILDTAGFEVLDMSRLGNFPAAERT